MIYHTSTQNGFLKMSLLGLIAILTFTFAGFDMRALTDSKQANKAVNKTTQMVTDLWQQYPGPYWQQYAQPHASYLWNDILIGTVQTNIEKAVKNVIADKPTQIDVLLNMRTNDHIKSGTTTPEKTNNDTATSSKKYIPSNPFQTQKLNF